MKKISYIVGLFCVASCSLFPAKQQGEKDVVVAEIDDKKLFLSEISTIFSNGISKKDSIELLRKYVNAWARQYLIAAKAEMYLDKEQKNVGRELEDYRLSLLSYRYETQYVNQKIDTAISQEEIELFYEQHAETFPLSVSCTQVTYVKVRKDVPGLSAIKRYTRQAKEESMGKLDSLCTKVNAVCDFFNDQWVSADFLTHKTVFMPEQCKQSLKEAGYLETADEQYIYMLNFRAVKREGDVAPLAHVRDDIVHLIIGKRKRDLIKNLENSAFNEALDYKRLKIYIDE
ncbi:MAG: hypothetical protein LBT61_00955 [Prevotellaceae bacterium]|jgi:hypothetical protein|nr:hypothetical protein [Prevotellaceae bacterium]